MTRWTTLVAATALAATLITPPVAAQAAADPVTSLKGQISAHEAVRVVEDSGLRHAKWGGWTAIRRGVLRLGGSGVAAADLTRTYKVSRLMGDHLDDGPWDADKVNAEIGANRSISANGMLYRSGPLYQPVLPDGRTWALAGRSGASAAYGDQIVNVFEPGTLKALLSTAAGKKASKYGIRKKATEYTGVITFRQLSAVSPTFRSLIGKRSLTPVAGTKITWHLRINDLGQALTLGTSWPIAGGYEAGVFSQYPGRGLPRRLKQNIPAPRAALVATPSTLTGPLPRPSSLLDATFSVG
ncbi:hypothetical protein [Sphaerisporangium dianthi]|uniref:Uncharacterized protein n=1 Tax=Sphaerisporangium dianthi TaxID=1436120 RepID=A0ABV9CE88_9ACTN